MNKQKTKHNITGLHSLLSFREEMDVVNSTCWRWMQKGWLGKPLNMNGRLYLTQEQVDEFVARLKAGEFAIEGSLGDRRRKPKPE